MRNLVPQRINKATATALIICFALVACSSTQPATESGSSASENLRNIDAEAVAGWIDRFEGPPDEQTIRQLKAYVSDRDDDPDVDFRLAQALNSCYFGCPRNPDYNTVAKTDNVFELVQRAADLNYAPAVAMLGGFYLDPPSWVPIRQDSMKGIRLLQEAMDRGVAAAFIIMGGAMRDGRNMPRDLKRAEELLSRAAAMSWPAAATQLAILRDIQGNATEAVILAQQGVTNGDPAAELLLSGWYRDGHNGLTANPDEANQLIAKAARVGNARAFYEMASIVEAKPTADAQNLAFKWYTTAAARGDANAEHRLSRIYMLAQLGRGYDKSDAIAAEMLAALNGNVQAERNMAMWFLAGTGVPIDVTTAATMSRNAEKRGDVVGGAIRTLIGNPFDDVGSSVSVPVPEDRFR